MQRHNVTAARVLRTRQTPAEAAHWHAIRSRQVDGLKFRRQHPIGPLVVDFCCPDRRLVIELDGGVHTTQSVADAEREELLIAAGYCVLRFSNDAVHHELSSIVDQIRLTAIEQPRRPAYAIARTAGWE